MFQPPSQYPPAWSYGATGEIPEITFEPTPLHSLSGLSYQALQQQHDAILATQHHQQHQHDLPSGLFASPLFSGGYLSSAASFSPHPQTHSSQSQSQHRQPRSSISRVKMEQDPSAAVVDDLAAQEAAARDYQPQLEGPLVGRRTPSTAITAEYAKADQIYVQKTLALPQTYSHYRPIQGDGNCGWRAIGFSYFELLVKGGSVLQVETELQRIRSLNQYIVDIGGYDPYLHEDMVEETIMLLQEVLITIGDGEKAMQIVETKFNTEETSNAIIYHLRLLAASFLKGHPEFEPFTGEVGIPGYCSEWIERPNKEIEHLGIVLLHGVLLKPVGFVLEIAYLDRSQGSEVNVYLFPDEANGQSPENLGPMMHLLYRPDHYDILYRPDGPQSAQPVIQPMVVQVHRAATSAMPNPKAYGGSLGQLGPSFHDLDLLPLTDLPGSWAGLGAALATGSSMLIHGADSPLDLDDPYASPIAPDSPWAVPAFTNPLAIRPPSSSMHHHNACGSSVGSLGSSGGSSANSSVGGSTPKSPHAPLKQSRQVSVSAVPPSQVQVQMQVQTTSPTSTTTPKTSASSTTNPTNSTNSTPPNSAVTPSDPVRFSAWKHKFDTSNPWPADQPYFRSNTFKNSHFNVAHYNNPNFQPEEYRPEDDYDEVLQDPHSNAAANHHVYYLHHRSGAAKRAAAAAAAAGGSGNNGSGAGGDGSAAATAAGGLGSVGAAAAGGGGLGTNGGVSVVRRGGGGGSANNNSDGGSHQHGQHHHGHNHHAKRRGTRDRDQIHQLHH